MKLKIEREFEVVLETDKDRLFVFKSALSKITPDAMTRAGFDPKERAMICELYYGLDDLLKVV